MTGPSDGELERPRDAEVTSVLDAVRQAALDLLQSLPERPERLRLRVAEITVELDWRVSAVSSLPASVSTLVPAPAAPAAAGVPIAAPSMDGQPSASPARPGLPTGAEDGPQALHYVCAPSVGTFYRAPEPGATPFVAEGETVNPGQQVAIVEAMKLMLPVEADRAGRVVEVLVADGQAVEYGDRLLALVPVGAD
jgi:acetyl-CoA carboxylase biotin carboxyl carrier protein